MTPRSRSSTSSLSQPATPRLARGLCTLRSLERLNQISTHISVIYGQTASLYQDFMTSALQSERSRSSSQLRAFISDLENSILVQKEAVQSVEVEDVAGLYVVAGMSERDALMEAKKDFEVAEDTMRAVNENMGKMLAGILYSLKGETEASELDLP